MLMVISIDAMFIAITIDEYLNDVVDTNVFATTFNKLVVVHGTHGYVLNKHGFRKNYRWIDDI